MKDKQQQNKSEQTLKVFGKKTNFFLFVLYILGAFLVGFFSIKIFLTLLLTPILAVYNGAYNQYIISNDPEYFKLAAIFAKNWLQAWIFLILGAMLLFFRKAIKNKLEENE